MESPDHSAVRRRPWGSLWIVAGLSFLAQLAICQFFTFGQNVPASLDVNPSNLWKLAYHFPPGGTFQVLNWLGVAYPPQPLNPLSLAAAVLAPWLFFTAYTPLMSTCALLAMSAVLRELELSRPAALFGAIVFAWQGDILPFVYPGHYGYITAWPFFAIAVWGALRAVRTRRWAYALISGVCCGTMVGLLTNADRGGIASLLVAAIFLAAAFRAPEQSAGHLKRLALCIGVAGIVALAPLLALYKSNISGVKLSGVSDREATYKLVTQFSLGPAETLTFLVPGFFGWHIHSAEGPYWGWIGEWPDYPKNHQGAANLNLAISTTGTVATMLALLGALVLLGSAKIPEHQRIHGRLILALGVVALVLSWGWHTGFYRPLFALPLMDKWRNPLKWIEITNFALVVLSAIGMERLIVSLDPTRPDARTLRSRLAWFGGGMVALLIVGWMYTFLFSMQLTPILEQEAYGLDAVVNMIDTMHRSVLVAIVLAALFCVVLFGLWQRDRLRTWTIVNPMLNRMWTEMLRTENLPYTLALALAALVVLQLGWVATQFVQPIPLAVLTATNPLLERLRHEGDTVRVSVASRDAYLETLLQNQFAAMDISSVDISAASRIPDRLEAYLSDFSKDRARMWFLSGVRNVIGPAEIMTELRADPNVAGNISGADGYTLMPTSSPDVPSHAVVVMKDYLAKATFVPRAEFLDSDDDILKRMKDPKWNPRATVLLSSSDKSEVNAVKPSSAAPSSVDNQVVLETYTPTEIVIKVRAAQAGYVLVDDAYDVDWTVEVNGSPAPQLCADYILRAVPVPAGESTVKLHYATTYMLPGLPNLRFSAMAVNCVSDFAMIGAWLVAGFALRRRHEESIPVSA